MDIASLRDTKNSLALARVRLGLLAMAIVAGSQLATPYSSARSCCGDCGCRGGASTCCVLQNGAICTQAP